MQKISPAMRRFAPEEEVDYLIVGVGSAGDLEAPAYREREKDEVRSQVR
jgi:BRCT domain type II-containing protein